MLFTRKSVTYVQTNKPPHMIKQISSQLFHQLARGPLGRLEVLWSKSSSVRPCVRACVRASVRACVRMMSQTCNRQNLRTVIGMDLLFFLMGWYKQGVVQWQTKLGLRMGKALICNYFLHYLLCNICILGNIWMKMKR